MSKGQRIEGIFLLVLMSFLSIVSVDKKSLSDKINICRNEILSVHISHPVLFDLNHPISIPLKLPQEIHIPTLNNPQNDPTNIHIRPNC
jgi:hypothetical protein